MKAGIFFLLVTIFVTACGNLAPARSIATSTAPLITLTPTATEAPTIPLTPTPTPILVKLTTKGQVNVRLGPGLGFQIMGKLSNNTTVPVFGKSVDSQWLYIAFPDANGRGWVSITVVEVSGPKDLLQIVIINPIHTATATLRQSTPTALKSTPTAIPIRVSSPTKTPYPLFVPPVIPPSSSSGCCKHCGPNSKPCGNSCISLNKNCNVGSGCACY